MMQINIKDESLFVNFVAKSFLIVHLSFNITALALHSFKNFISHKLE